MIAGGSQPGDARPPAKLPLVNKLPGVLHPHAHGKGASAPWQFPIQQHGIGIPGAVPNRQNDAVGLHAAARPPLSYIPMRSRRFPMQFPGISRQIGSPAQADYLFPNAANGYRTFFRPQMHRRAIREWKDQLRRRQGFPSSDTGVLTAGGELAVGKRPAPPSPKQTFPLGIQNPSFLRGKSRSRAAIEGPRSIPAVGIPALPAWSRKNAAGPNPMTRIRPRTGRLPGFSGSTWTVAQAPSPGAAKPPPGYLPRSPPPHSGTAVPPRRVSRDSRRIFSASQLPGGEIPSFFCRFFPEALHRLIQRQREFTQDKCQHIIPL